MQARIAQGVYHLNDGQAHNMSDFCRAMGHAVDKALKRRKHEVHVIHMPPAHYGAHGRAFIRLRHCCRRPAGQIARSFGERLRRAPNWNLDKYREARQAGWLSDGSRIRRELGFTA